MREPNSIGMGAAKLGGYALSGLLGTTFLCGTAAPGLAAGKEGDFLDVSRLEAVSDRTLGDLRGGFRVGNYDISFGVTVTTTINGGTVLQTTFHVTNPGQIGQAVTQWLQDGQNLFDSKGSKVDVDVEIDKQHGVPDVDADVDVEVQAQGVDVDIDVNVLAQPATGPNKVAPVDQVSLAVAELSPVVSVPESAVQTAEPMPAVDFASAPPVAADDAIASIAAVVDPGTMVDTATAEPSLALMADPNTIVQAANGFSLVKTGNGFALNGPGTTVIHEVTNGVLTEIINANNNVAISHSTEMNMTIANFSDVARQGAIGQQLQNLTDEINNHGL